MGPGWRISRSDEVRSDEQPGSNLQIKKVNIGDAAG